MAPLIVLLLVFLLRPVDPKVYETDDAIIIEAGEFRPSEECALDLSADPRARILFFICLRGLVFFSPP